MRRLPFSPVVPGHVVLLLTLIAAPEFAAADEVARRVAWTASRVQGSPVAPEPYRLVSAFPGLRFALPTCIEEFPGAERLLITERDGKILSFPNRADANQADLVVDLLELLPADLANRKVSLWDAEFHPRFDENRYLFVCYVHPGEGGHTRVSRFTLDDSAPPRAVPNSEQVVIIWPAGGHNAGCLEFGTDRCLYIATGDGSGPNPPDGLTTGQDVTDLLGAILRVDVDHTADGRNYAVPDDNPLVGLSGARPEIWAYGLRNPWKFGVDPQTGDMFAADNGWETWEMVHRIVRGGNCGWPIMEGRAVLRSEVKPGPTPILPPAQDHPHTEANSVIGGPVYRGARLPDLVGSFIYGDYITGTIWAIRPDRDGAYSHTTLVDTDQRIIAFTETSDGRALVLDYDLTGKIYELQPSGLLDTSATFPRRLSETGLFESVATMQPAAGVVPYAVRVDPWMDGAEARRWVAIPGDGIIQLVDGSDAPAEYPEGTVLVKHLTLPQSGGQPIRLETQLLHYEHGKWNPYSYLWDESGLDAALVEPNGASRVLRLPDPATKGGEVERTWHASAVNECKLCHNAGAGFVLGFVANQLDRPPLDGRSEGANQIQRLIAQGALSTVQRMSTADPSRLVDPRDAARSLDDRARSYLHANCAMCHHPGGNAIVSFYLRRELPFDKLNTNKGTGIGTFGLRDAKLIVPGDPYRSLLLYRMTKLGYARMPYVGSRVVDSEGVALMEAWIRSLPDEGAAAPTTAEFASMQPVEESVKTSESGLALAVALHRGLLDEPQRSAAVAAGSAAPSDVRGLFEHFVPEANRRPTLGASIDPMKILALKGNVDRGKLIYFSDGARCRNCHEIDDRAKSFGPTLREITKKHPKSLDILQHALQPSLKIEEPYIAYSLVTDDGRALSGMLVEQNEGDVVLKTPEKQLTRVARANIEELRKSDKSLMPERILSDLTAQEAADLIEYIRQQREQP